ncbi:MAG: uroporphyrinogen-III synthase [Moorea sp. SIO2B7]|nr:uroporphyrinogen-III synthase [Moorena sp. SIO2B7]
MFNDIHLTSSHLLPLYGKRILITAPRNYASRLCQHIINKGGLPILMPTIETCLLTDYNELDTALKQIEKFDWITFTSRKGIEAFFYRLNCLDLPIYILKNCQLSAIGKDTERLLDFGLNVDLIPTEASPAGIIAELSKIPNIDNKSVLVPVPKVVGIPEPNIVPNFILGLNKLGMKVTSVITYTTRCLDENIYEIELNLIRQNKIDVIAFSSTGEIEAFLNMINSKRDYDNCVIGCFGPYTAANAKKLGINVSIVAKDFRSFEGFAEAIATFFAKEGQV